MWIFASYGEALIEHGQDSSDRRSDLFLNPERTGAPLVLAIGDSTMRLRHHFPRHVADRLGTAAEVRAFWNVGLSPAEAALLASRALELSPQAMILLAHFATFEAPEPLRYREFARLVPPRRLPSLLPLPFSSRGLGVGELVLGSFAGSLIPNSYRLAFAGGAMWLQEELESRWDVEPGSDFHRLSRFGALRKVAILRTAEYGYPGHASVVMLRGAVRMIEDAGTPVLVVVSPVNIGPLQKHGAYDAAEIASRVRYVTEMVESVGGDVLDMHDGLPPEEFRDELGHYTKQGAYRISLPVEDWTRRTLGLPPRRR